jgi:imidazolonepropionase-like amidohydrolase
VPAGGIARLAFGAGEADVPPGRFGVPGLVDSHCHLTTGPGETYDADPREHPAVLASPAAVVLNHRRIS